jgi:sec-independent protein translocase protein TatA
MGLQGTDWIWILLAIILLFGASAIPKLAKSLGQAKGEFEKGVKQGREKVNEKDSK